jgi:signal transduction histidine kinase/ActR/RegA family two-component response regulator
MLGKDFKLLRKHYLSEEEIIGAYEELNKNTFWNAVTILIGKSGQEVHVKISVTPIMYGNKRILIYRVIDITAMKENETKLIEAKESAEEAVKAKGQFLAMMSHEIRTPLNGVIATASMLTRTKLDTEQSEYVDTIKKSGQNLLMLINDILDFSKMESGKMTLDPQPSSPDEIVFDVADLLRPYAEEKGITLNVNLSTSGNDNLLIDGLKLKQVLLNLLGNALKFTEKGSVTIRCEKIGMIQETEIIRYVISDTGIGISEDKMHLLFRSFSQVDSSTSRKYGGTGLGLAISQQIVELMGGAISVESMVGEGTTFSFTLKHMRTSPIELEPSSQSQVETSVNDFSKINVLVADDNEINRQVFKYMLDALNINSDIAVDGLQVLARCAEKKYDLIFMDMQMPEMDGIEATRKIRAEIEHQPIIVAVTANSFVEDRERCIKSGMNDFLSKPFDNVQLVSLLQRIFISQSSPVDSAA